MSHLKVKSKFVEKKKNISLYKIKQKVMIKKLSPEKKRVKKKKLKMKNEKK